MSRFYTGVGDSGYSNMLGKMVEKSSPIVEAIGNVDELNSFIGATISNVDDDRIAKILKGVQENLFIIGAELSAVINKRFAPREKMSEAKTKDLERVIADLSAGLPDLNKFVLPGGSESASYLHISRSVSRRAERSVIRLGSRLKNRDVLPYLNRLSSLLFVAALYMNKKEGIDEANPHY